jgi:Zn-dependent peptidase ImmA (M78 family)
LALLVPILSYEDLRSKADALLSKHHPSGAVPVPIEQIVEFDFDIQIIPVPGLQRVHEIDAFSSQDFEAIMIDRSVMESHSPYRYHFSLAHELAHAVLHRDVQRQLSFKTADDWKRAVASISEKDREWFEWQAYSFAGLFLVPNAALRNSLADAVGAAEKQGFSLRQYPDPSKDYVCSFLGRTFEVSSQVISKRIDKDGLWPP